MSEIEREDEREAELEERKRILQQRQARLSAIAQHPEWPEVVAEAERYVAFQRRKVEDLIWSGDTLPHAEIAYIRGLCDGYMAFVLTPGNAEEKLRKALEDAVEEERHRAALRAAEEELHYA